MDNPVGNDSQGSQDNNHSDSQNQSQPANAQIVNKAPASGNKFGLFLGFSSYGAQRVLAIVGLIIVAAAIPLTVFLSQRQQEIRQRASEVTPTPTPTPPSSCEAKADIMILLDTSVALPSNNTAGGVASSDPLSVLIYEKEITKALVRQIGKENKNKVGIVSFKRKTTTYNFPSPSKVVGAKLEVPLGNNYNLDDVVDGIGLEPTPQYSFSSSSSTCIECGIAEADKEFESHKEDDAKKIIILLTNGDLRYKSNFNQVTEGDSTPVYSAVSSSNSLYKTQFFTIVRDAGGYLNDALMYGIARTGGRAYLQRLNASSETEMNKIYQEIINPEDTPCIPSPTISATPTTSISPTITASLTPTVTDRTSVTPGQSATTTIDYSFKLQAIGNDTQHSENPDPRFKERSVNIEVFDNANNKLGERRGMIPYDSRSGLFKGSFQTTEIPAGEYNVVIKIKSNKYLRRLIGKDSNSVLLKVKAGQNNMLPLTTLLIGDINNDNDLDIEDYNIYLSCFGGKSNNSLCGEVDLNDDGIWDTPQDLRDYKWLFENFQLQSGD